MFFFVVYVRRAYVGFVDLKFLHTVTSRSILVLCTKLRLLFQVLSFSERSQGLTFPLYVNIM